MSKKAETEKNSPVVSPSEVLQSFLNAHPEDHFNGERNGIDLEYKISSGSLKLDLELGGGLGCGVHRFIGVREGGKTRRLWNLQEIFNSIIKTEVSLCTTKPRAV